MAEVPDIRPGGWPEPAPPTAPGALKPFRPMGEQAPRFGVAHDLDLIQRGVLPPSGGRSSPSAVRRRRAAAPDGPGTWDHFMTWWTDSDLQPTFLWHRVQCRRGRHDFQGGRRIQVGGRFVNTERCCAWCEAKPL